MDGDSDPTLNVGGGGTLEMGFGFVFGTNLYKYNVLSTRSRENPFAS